MSEVRDIFESAAHARQWNRAFTYLNGLNMYEMLRSLAGLEQALLDELLTHSTDFWYPVDMPRIAFAATVVKERKIPEQVPGDLAETNQVLDAKTFLAEQGGRGGWKTPAPTKTRAGELFLTADRAAFAAIDEIAATSIVNNWEYAGRILQVRGAESYLFTQARTDKNDRGSDPGPRQPAYTNVGTYHTHAGGFFASDEYFSADDKWKATMGKELCYLGTPRGRILRFTPLDLLSAEEQETYPDGRIDMLRIANVLVVGHAAG